jgi:hypothetical protein
MTATAIASELNRRALFTAGIIGAAADWHQHNKQQGEGGDVLDHQRLRISIQ